MVTDLELAKALGGGPAEFRPTRRRGGDGAAGDGVGHWGYAHAHKVWGGTVLEADVSHPAWQERIREVVTRWAKEFGFEGARLDMMG